MCFMCGTKMLVLVRVCFHLLACCIHMAASCLRKCTRTATTMTFKVRHCHECVLADVDYAGYALRSATFSCQAWCWDTSVGVTGATCKATWSATLLGGQHLQQASADKLTLPVWSWFLWSLRKLATQCLRQQLRKTASHVYKKKPCLHFVLDNS